MELLRNNIYGIGGISAKDANMNAGFDGRPKRGADGKEKSSSESLQYTIKVQWENEGKQVFGMKSRQEDGTCLILQQRYDCLNPDDKNNKGGIIKTRNNLFKNIDCINFGFTYTGKQEVDVRGVAQFTDAQNKYEDTIVLEEKVLSPFRNPKSKDDNKEIKNKGKNKKIKNEENEDETESKVKNTTIGTKYITDEAHYAYGLSVFPKQYDEYINNEFEGYTEENWQDLKRALLISVSNYNSKAKAGCKNEFAMFVRVKEDSNYKLDLNGLQDYVKVYKENDDKKGEVIVYDLLAMDNLLGKLENEIESIEVYYNYRLMNIKIDNNDKMKFYDLITRKEIGLK